MPAHSRRILLLIGLCLTLLPARALAAVPRSRGRLERAPAPEGTGLPTVTGALGSGPDTVSAFGTAPSFGPSSSLQLNQPVVGMAGTTDTAGYWLVAADGGIFNYGDAPFLGSAGSLHLNKPVVGIAADPTGMGYWMVAADGGVFNYGAAAFAGSAGGMPLNAAIVGMAPDPNGGGYWLVASDGGIFNYGSARFLGSMGGTRLNSPVVGMAATPDGGGYWLVAADGGVFNFGDAAFYGSAAGQTLAAPVVGIAASPGGSGYWLAGSDGEVYACGVASQGAATGVAGAPPAVAIAASGSAGYWVVEGGVANTYSMSPGPGLSALQQRLQSLGYWDGGPTGAMNDATTQAIWAFQKFQHLPITGTLDPAGLQALANASRPAAPTAGSGTAIVVDKGPDLVYLVQNGFTAWVFNTSTGGGYTYYSQGVRSVAVTPDGTFRMQYGIDGWHTSPLGQMWRPRFFVGGYALHGDSYVPAHPVSHGCVRVSIEAMNFIWDSNLAPIGEEVDVIN